MSELSKVIAIFGAGKGLSASVARRFARENFRVALVARTKERLDALVAELNAEGIEAAGFTADLSKPHDVPAVVDAVRDRFGRIDVVEYGPINGELAFTPAARLDAATLEKGSPLLLLTPVEVARAVPAGVDRARRRSLPDDHRLHGRLPETARQRGRPPHGRRPQLVVLPQR